MVLNVRAVLLGEGAQGAKHGIGRRLSQPAQAGVLEQVEQPRITMENIALRIGRRLLGSAKQSWDDVELDGS